MVKSINDRPITVLAALLLVLSVSFLFLGRPWLFQRGKKDLVQYKRP